MKGLLGFVSVSGLLFISLAPFPPSLPSLPRSPRCFFSLRARLHGVSYRGVAWRAMLVLAYAQRLAATLNRDDEVNILQVVCFVSILLLSFPVIRFTARLFAYIITTQASALLYRGNR